MILRSIFFGVVNDGVVIAVYLAGLRSRVVSSSAVGLRFGAPEVNQIQA